MCRFTFVVASYPLTEYVIGSRKQSNVGPADAVLTVRQKQTEESAVAAQNRPVRRLGTLLPLVCHQFIYFFC